MNDKITMPMLATMLAEKTGFSKKQCEDFLREFFVTVSDTLASGENVKIKGLGSFRIISVAPRKSVDVNTGEDIEIPGHNKIVFAASKELAEEVNEPFSIFESVELDDSYEEPEQKAVEPPVATEPDALVISEKRENHDEPKPTDEKVVFPEEVRERVKAATSEYVIEDIEDSPNKSQIEPEQEKEPAAQGADEIAEEEIADETLHQAEEFEKPRRRRFGFMMGFASGIAVMAIIGFGIWYFCLRDAGYIYPENKTSQIADNAVEKKQPKTLDQMMSEKMAVDSVSSHVGNTDEAVEVPTAASDQVVYDTISKTRFLTTMAMAHYGNFNLWPYIYEENKSFLGHPDRIRPGTRVVIPSLSKYGIDPKNPEDIKKAKRKGVEIYSKYK